MAPISNASRLSDFGSGIGTQGSIIQVDNSNKRLGVGTDTPLAMLQVGTGVSVYGDSGIVSATTYYGSGASLTGIAATDHVSTFDLVVAGIATFHNDVRVTAGGLDVVGVVPSKILTPLYVSRPMDFISLALCSSSLLFRLANASWLVSRRSFCCGLVCS